MPKNSRAKGAAGERELAKLLRDMGFEDARRGQQYCGTADSPDVKCDSLPFIHLEAKRVEALRDSGGLMDGFWRQVCSEADGKEPVILWRTNRRDWRITYYCPTTGVRVTAVGQEHIKRVLIELNAKRASQ